MIRLHTYIFNLESPTLQDFEEGVQTLKGKMNTFATLKRESSFHESILNSRFRSNEDESSRFPVGDGVVTTLKSLVENTWLCRQRDVNVILTLSYKRWFNISKQMSVDSMMWI